MQTTHTPEKRSPTRGAKRECCIDAPCDSGLRNEYFEGKRLTADSFRVEQSYLVERRRLLNRAIHGWGVVYGYAVKPARTADPYEKDAAEALEIGPGLALDECGRELLLTRATSLSLRDLILFDKKGERLERPPEGSYEPHRPTDQALQKQQAPTQGPHEHDEQQRGDAKFCWLLSAHYAEQSVGPLRTINDPCSCEREEWEHVCETVRFSLRRIDCDECCKPFDCELTCGCGAGRCCRETEARKTSANPVRRGGCQCLCDHLTGLSLPECCALREINDPCARVRADLHHGVPLACVRLRQDDCDDWLFERSIEACGPRRLVKRNDALFDLIRGCDLTRISEIGWAPWHRSKQVIEWEQFEPSFGEPAQGEGGRERKGKTKPRRERIPLVTRDYWVRFSRPVREETVRADCFSMTVLVEESEGGWDVGYRVPILGVRKWAEPGTPAGHLTRATIIVDEGWFNDAVRGDNTIFDEDPTTVEIEIRGDFIVDCNGQTIDANSIGLLAAPTGNGAPGGTFHSSFRVQPRYAEYRVPDESAERSEGVES
jgi:hypothetical protein